MSLNGAPESLSDNEAISNYFIQKVIEGDLESVTELHDYPFPLNVIMTSLLRASLGSKEDIINHILDNIFPKYDRQEIENENGYFAALYAASKNGQLNIVKSLLTHPQKKPATFFEIGSAFCFALRFKHLNVIEYIRINYSLILCQFFLKQFDKLSSLEIAYFNDFIKLELLELLPTEILLEGFNNIRYKNAQHDDAFLLTFDKINEDKLQEQSEINASSRNNMNIQSRITMILLERDAAPTPILSSSSTHLQPIPITPQYSKLYPSIKSIRKEQEQDEQSREKQKGKGKEKELKEENEKGKEKGKEKEIESEHKGVDEIEELLADFYMEESIPAFSSSIADELRRQGTSEQDIAAILDTMEKDQDEYKDKENLRPEW